MNQVLHRSPPVIGVLRTDYAVENSLWQATANPFAALPALQESQRTDVAVIGGGYLGLSCALRLAESGAQALVLDAHGPGYGASGRNGGQVIPGLKYDPDELVEMYGSAQAEPMIAFAASTADKVFDVVRQYSITCDPVRQGWIQGAHNDAMLRTTERRARQWMARGADVELLDAPAIARLIGNAPGLYRGGWIDRRAGSVQPLNYALGLAQAAATLGARLYRDSPAVRIEPAGKRWRIVSAGGGQVEAEQVVIATNAYTDVLWPKLQTSIVPAQSSQVATDPLPDALRASILPGGQVVSDARRLLYYYRLDAAGRLIIGGRGPLSIPRGPVDYAHIRRALIRTFPQLGDVPMPYYWSGRLAMTRDSLPHVHQPESGITIALGCNGRGVGLTTAVGQSIADHLTHGARSPLPFAVTPIRSIPLHRLHKLYVSLAVQYYKVRDLF